MWLCRIQHENAAKTMRVCPKPAAFIVVFENCHVDDTELFRIGAVSASGEQPCSSIVLT